MKSLRIKFILVFLWLIFSSSESHLQTPAESQINELKNGSLLVRLSTNGPALIALRSKGFDKRADELERTTMLTNLAWVQAFRKEFTFCPVYFFYSNYSESISAGNISEVVFLDDELEPTTFTPSEGIPFYIGDITNVSSESSNVNFEALIIKDANFKQLEKPFPVYVRTFNSLAFLKRKPNKVVRIMNYKLREFYEEKS